MTTPATPRIVSEARGVSREFGTGDARVSAVRDVSVRFSSGEFSAIMGPSGSGKSTLMYLLAGLDSPTRGAVTLDGNVVSAMSESELAALRHRSMGFVFQSFNLLPTLSVLENIRLPESLGDAPRPHDRAWEAELMARLGITALGDRLPGELSGGQQQRVAIARALAHRPSIVFADEPTGNLDATTGAEVLGLLSALAHDEGCAIVMVTHDPVAAGAADRLVVVRDGAVTHELGKTSVADIAVLLSTGARA